MLKRGLTIFICVLLLLGTAGITVSMHYCGNNLVSFLINGKAKSCCGEKCKFCHDKTLQYKISDNFIKPLINLNSNQPNVIIENVVIESSQELYLCDFSHTRLFLDSASPPEYKISNPFLEVFRL